MEAEVEELKQDLSSFRFEVLNKLDTQSKSIEDCVLALHAKLDMMTYQQRGATGLYSSYQYSPSDVTPTTSKVTDWRCDDIITPELNVTLASEHAPSETDSVINGDHGNLKDFKNYDNSDEEEEFVTQKLQHSLSEKNIKSKDSDPLNEQSKLLKKRPHGHRQTDDDG